MSNGYGGKRRNAGRPTMRQQGEQRLRPGEKERSVRMLATDIEYRQMMQLPPSQRTFALLTGWAVLTKLKYERQAWQPKPVKYVMSEVKPDSRSK